MQSASWGLASIRARALSISISDPRGTWGGRFPVRATAFAEETPPVRETLADSRTMKGSSAAD